MNELFESFKAKVDPSKPVPVADPPSANFQDLKAGLRPVAAHPQSTAAARADEDQPPRNFMAQLKKVNSSQKSEKENGGNNIFFIYSLFHNYLPLYCVLFVYVECTYTEYLWGVMAVHSFTTTTIKAKPDGGIKRKSKPFNKSSYKKKFKAIFSILYSPLLFVYSPKLLCNPIQYMKPLF